MARIAPALSGRIEVICGPMFAGKTEELIRRVRRAAIARRPVQVFTHAVDTRSRAETIGSHSGLEFPSMPVSAARDIASLTAADTQLVGIDEAQFFGMELVPVAGEMALQGIDVVIAGLDVTFTGRPFEPLPALMALAERVDKLTAVCAVCGADAVYHQRVEAARADPLDLSGEHIGGLEKYEARCRRHFTGQ
jgi:thymidine kinase